MIGWVFTRSQGEFQNCITASWFQQSLNRAKAVLNGQNGPSDSRRVRETPWSTEAKGKTRQKSGK
jgi:hypothetical protein